MPNVENLGYDQYGNKIPPAPYLKWTCEIEIYCALEVDLTQERLQEMLERDIACQWPEQVRCKILGKPTDDELKAAREWVEEYW